MKECREKKRLQIYIDGWMDESETERFENHLRKCDECQGALMDLEEISASALEIVDHAPEREYWGSFFARVQNRIISRGISPYEETKKSTFRTKLASYSIGIMTMAAAFILVFNLISRVSFGPDTAAEFPIEDTAPATVEAKTDNPVLISGGKIALGGAIPRVNEDSDELVSTVVRDLVKTIPAPAIEPSNDLARSVSIDIELSTIENRDYESAFRGPFRVTPAELRLSDDENFITRLLAEYGSLSGEDFSVSPNVVAEGILSNYAYARVGRNKTLLKTRSIGIADPVNPGWGYLGISDDSVNTEGYRRYMIELDLTRAK